MQNVDKPVDIDTSGPGAEIELDENKETLVEGVVVQDDKQTYEKKKEHGTDISYENEREQNLKTVVAPMTQMRNLMSQLMFKMKKRKVKTKRKN